MKFEVSICIPVFNMADTIERACMSALRQKYSNAEEFVPKKNACKHNI